MWRSLVAHLTGGQGAAGSNPVIPTRITAGQGRCDPLRMAPALMFAGNGAGNRNAPGVFRGIRSRGCSSPSEGSLQAVGCFALLVGADVRVDIGSDRE
jgi:hypothetical protein